MMWCRRKSFIRATSGFLLPRERIRETLREAGVTEMRTWAEVTEPEYCEDCGAPLFPNHEGEVVHAEMPADAEPEATHFH